MLPYFPGKRKRRKPESPEVRILIGGMGDRQKIKEGEKMRVRRTLPEDRNL